MFGIIFETFGYVCLLSAIVSFCATVIAVVLTKNNSKKIAWAIRTIFFVAIACMLI